MYYVSIYRIAGNFREVLIFVIFVTIPRVTKFSTHEFSVGYCECASQPGEYGVNRTHVLKGSNSYRNGSLSLSTPHRVRRAGIDPLRESRNLKPRKLILKIRDSFSRKFAPPKITRYTVILLYGYTIHKKLLSHSKCYIHHWTSKVLHMQICIV